MSSQFLHCDMPMTRDQAVLNACHDQAADDICALLDEGKNVAFLTLGDPAVYSTYWYVHRRVQARGYTVEIVPGVPSFCAAAARLGQALCEGSQMLHIIPASHSSTKEGLALSGNKILMKAGKSILEVRDLLEADGKLDSAALVERCSMEGERVVRDLRCRIGCTRFDYHSRCQSLTKGRCCCLCRISGKSCTFRVLQSRLSDL